jgi:hypothetical protein
MSLLGLLRLSLRPRRFLLALGPHVIVLRPGPLPSPLVPKKEVHRASVLHRDDGIS